MTNLIECITSLVLVTNVTTEYQTRTEGMPCPDGMIGCLVMHYREVPVENPQQRWVVTKIRELELVALPSLGITNTRSDRLVSETRQEQHTVVTWQDGAMETNSVTYPTGGETNVFSQATNMTISSLMFGWTNAISIPAWRLDGIPDAELRDELRRREEKK
jgi:hypothetical protein